MLLRKYSSLMFKISQNIVLKGERGEQGSRGFDGRDGEPGRDGMPGMKGERGPPVSFQKIQWKIFYLFVI